MESVTGILTHINDSEHFFNYKCNVINMYCVRSWRCRLSVLKQYEWQINVQVLSLS
jgi:hypothetical protein